MMGLRERGNDTSRSTGSSGRQNAATRRNMRREERVTVQGPVKEQQPAQPRHTNDWAPRTRKRHQQEHRPQRPTERSDPTQHAKGRTGDCPGPRKGITTRRNVPQGGGGVKMQRDWVLPRRPPWYGEKEGSETGHSSQTPGGGGVSWTTPDALSAPTHISVQRMKFGKFRGWSVEADSTSTNLFWASDPSPPHGLAREGGLTLQWGDGTGAPPPPPPPTASMRSTGKAQQDPSVPRTGGGWGSLPHTQGHHNFLPLRSSRAQGGGPLVHWAF